MAQLASQQALEEIGFRPRGPTQESGKDFSAAISRSRTRRGQDLVEGTVEVGDREHRLVSRRDFQAEHCRPANADAALTGLPGQKPDGSLDLVGWKAFQQLGECRDLGRASPRRGYGARCRDDVCQQHEDSVPESLDPSNTAP